MSGLLCEHPLQAKLHQSPESEISHNCPECNQLFTGKVRPVYQAYKEHVLDCHEELLEDCGCCGGLHFPEFAGDCREDWERF